MQEEERLQKIKEIKDQATPVRTGHPIIFQGERKTFNIYRIPLKLLVYNPYNGRIASRVLSYEKSNGLLNPEIQNDIKIIEDFLWKSKENRNKTTMESLAKDGQNVVGIVTSNGQIIDGNRRAMLLNKIYRERDSWDINVDHAQYFEAAILPIDAQEKDINKLETEYQMGEDEKLDYNPIEKYLKCKKLRELEFTPNDIANMMRETESKIKEWLVIMKLMDEYLEWLGDDYMGMYTGLDGKEDQFITLYIAMRNYKNRSSSKPNWDYDENDVHDLKVILFDYIRSGYEGKEMRNISLNSDKNTSFFCKKELWNQFKKEHQEVNKISEEQKTVEEYREENLDYPLEKILEIRESDWISEAENIQKRNMSWFRRKFEDLQLADQPNDLIESALNSLESIDKDQIKDKDENMLSTITKVNKLSYDIIRYIKRL